MVEAIHKTFYKECTPYRDVQVEVIICASLSRQVTATLQQKEEHSKVKATADSKEEVQRDTCREEVETCGGV